LERLRESLHSHGYNVPPEKFRLDGTLQRFPRNNSKDSGWFIGWLHNYVKRPGTYCIAQFGDWRTGEIITYTPSDLVGAEKKLAKGIFDQARKVLDAERTVLRKKAVESSSKAISTANRQGVTAYTAKKKVDDLHGALVDGDQVLVPMHDISGNLVGLQTILPDSQKFFKKGQQVDGAYFLIGTVVDELDIVEGWATGITVHKAGGRPVAVAFNAGNLVKVARAFREKYPDADIRICGDDDRFNEVNTGREKAEAAADAVMGTAIFPQFNNPDSKGTDFNDLEAEEGLAVVRNILLTVKEPENGFKCLGYDDGGHYFFNIGVRDIFRLSAFTPQNLFILAPERWWIDNYTPPEGTKPLWLRASNDLIAGCQARGRFDPNRVRGMGVWLDKGRVVVNTGERLIINGKERGLYWPEGESIYVQSTHKMPAMREPATTAECDPLYKALRKLKWADPISAILLLGWIATSRIAGALPVHPHIWLTGGSGTGKTTVEGEIILPALGGSACIMQVQGGTTEAGIRQTLRASSIPMLFDEFESTSKSTTGRHEAIVELLRNTWSATSGQIVKGSAGGASQCFNLSFSAMVSSIGVNLNTDADRSRFSVLELLPHGDGEDDWESLRSLMDQINVELGHKIFARMVGMVPQVLACYEVFRKEIAAVSRQRMGQQLGMLFAGAWMLMSDTVASKEDAADLVGHFKLGAENEERIPEEVACLKHLLTQIVRFDVERNESVTIQQAISEEKYHQELRKYGILVERKAIFIAETHAWLASRFADTQWANWTRHLRRLPGAEKTDKKYFAANERIRTTKIPRAE